MSSCLPVEIGVQVPLFRIKIRISTSVDICRSKYAGMQTQHKKALLQDHLVHSVFLNTQFLWFCSLFLEQKKGEGQGIRFIFIIIKTIHNKQLSIHNKQQQKQQFVEERKSVALNL